MCLFTSRWNNDYNQLFGAAPKLKKQKTKQNKTKQTKNRKKKGRKAGKSNFNFFGLEN